MLSAVGYLEDDVLSNNSSFKIFSKSFMTRNVSEIGL